MAVMHRDHVSGEVGHTAGLSRVLLVVGLVLLVAGVVAFLGAAVWGILDASTGSSGGDSARLLPLGGLAVVIGVVVAAIGMTLARREAGE